MEAKESTTTPQTIVVAVDLSDASDGAVVCAMRIARTVDALHVVHAVEVSARRRTERLEEGAEVLDEGPDVVRQYLNTVCERENVWPVAKLDVHVRIEPPGAAILQFCADVEADMLVCGAHSRHGIDRLVHGSVSEMLVREATCPVLVVKPKDYSGQPKSDVAAPPCADCVAKRKETGDPGAWCEVHSREQQTRHTYGVSPGRDSKPPGFGLI